jgi:hypothetical protein
MYASRNQLADLNKITTCRVGLMNINFREFLLAALPLDAYSKLGGPIVGPQYVSGGGSSAGVHDETMWPFTARPVTNKQPGASPAEWWRWSLLLMFPREPNMFFRQPQQPTLEQMGEIFGGWQLYRHIKTKVAIMAAQDGGAFSPVASLVSQNNYFWRRQERGTPKPGEPPMTGMIRRGTGSLESSKPADEYYIPANPPNPPDWPGESSAVIDTPYKIAAVRSKSYVYSNMLFPSFSALSALGAAWAFPPGRRSVGRGSFNRHTITGAGDPQGKKWLTLVPKKVEWITDDTMQQSEIDTTIATIYVAQGAPKASGYKFQTFQGPLVDDPLSVQPWAVMRVKSVWQLGNLRRPYPWDVNWYNQVADW